MTTPHYVVTKKTGGALKCPICGEYATVLSFVNWHSITDEKGIKTYIGKGTKCKQYDHEFDVLGGFVQTATRSCNVPNEEIICEHNGRFSSAGRCLRCKMIVKPKLD